MNRLRTILLVGALSGCATFTACASKPATSTAESGTPIDANTSAKLTKGTTTEAQVKEILGAEPASSEPAADGRTLWVYAWSRATADAKGTVHALEIRELKIWIKDGVVDDFAYNESKQ